MPSPFPRYATTLVASAARTTDAYSDVLTMPDDIVGGSFYLACSSVGASTTHTLDVAYYITPDDGTTYLPVARHTQLSAAINDIITICFTPFMVAGSVTAAPAATGGALYGNVTWSRKFKAYWTLGGTSPTITFAIHFIGYRLPLASVY